MLLMKVREFDDTNLRPTAAIIDSQSVKTTHIAEAERGYDSEKKVNGRKRHIVVDTLGRLLHIAEKYCGINDQRSEESHGLSGLHCRRRNREACPACGWDGEHCIPYPLSVYYLEGVIESLLKLTHIV